MNLRELQLIELNILKEINTFCKKNNITYFLAAGSLIGAIRHKGFIPWDDDIDIFMKRDDYYRFIECWSKENNTRFKLLNIYDNNSFYYPYIKFVDSNYKCIEYPDKVKKQDGMAVWVDIFPLDNYYDKFNWKKKKILNYKRIVSLESKLYYGNKANKNIFYKIIKNILYILYNKKNPHEYAVKIDQLSQKCKKETGKLFLGFSPVEKKDVYDSEWFSDVIYLDFEDDKYPCPVGYDKILKHRYGDYMQLPSERERTTHHEILIEER